jgi:hypothetical protein
MAMAMVVASPAGRLGLGQRRMHAQRRAAIPGAGRQPLASTVPRELMFKACARLMATVWRASCPRRRRPQDRWRRATKTLSCYSRDLASRTGTLDGSQSNPPCRRNRFRAERQAARFYRCLIRFPARLMAGFRSQSLPSRRIPAIAAGKFAEGRMMIRPLTSAGSRLRMSLPSATWPSYSLPWLPAINRIRGPLPFLGKNRGVRGQCSDRRLRAGGGV